MSRLTKKLTEPTKYLKYIYIDSSDRTDFAILNKLGQLEDIEDELGIDLITLFKALKQGIYTKDNVNFIPYSCLLRNDFILVLFDDIYKHEYLLKDYGKTWALTREE